MTGFRFPIHEDMTAKVILIVSIAILHTFQIIKMPTHIPAGNHTNAQMLQIQMAPPIVAGNDNHATMNRSPILMKQQIAPKCSHKKVA